MFTLPSIWQFKSYQSISIYFVEMDRNSFLKTLTLTPFLTMDITKIISQNEPNNSTKMPVLFLGHGSPMNAIENNEFVQGWKNIATTIPTPTAILCVSAHWETKGTKVTAMEKPRTIHDFGGFPKALFEVEYPALGSPQYAKETKTAITTTNVLLDEQWGLDHGCWSVVKNLYPSANIPTFQLSLDYSQPAQYHYNLAKELSSLRNKGVLIIGSGNIVHNLGLIAWDKMHQNNYAFDWAAEANEKVKTFIKEHNHKSLINYAAQGTAFNLAIPTPEHYLPLLYTLALQTDKDEVSIFNDKAVMGSLTMTSIKIG